MIKTEFVTVEGWAAAIRGMRNPLESWEKSDSYFNGLQFIAGENDLKLMRSLCASGSDHRKYMRAIMVSMDVTAPAFWWTEYDTYKIATVRNSCSKMHKIHAHMITPEAFTAEGIAEIGGYCEEVFNTVVGACEALRENYNETGDKKYWRALIELLPHGYNMRATVYFNYETAFNMYRARKDHKLTEWRTFTDVLAELPYFRDITGV